ncbi:DNA-binding IclR family transcriptional regulator [Pseudonocardia hierapolitana]|uniref:DNA-binding IclR family transcriptional regulator n=1 Tax=Pseudonocardia hierapolitana TaxID=1128676 RepID=A0A561T0E8_9PSEU|nr:helix-turn-helix domain-containing protein [Pseudonocardia hierapolitana]TWF80589.1 DNA-binding IclR family transcriptional regulator [Pseudonocardia hierapolitana]
MTSGSGGTGDIQAVQRVGQLLALFTVNRPRLTVAEAASLVGLNRSTVSRYFGSLVLAGVLERSREEQAAYEPGPLLVQLGAVAQGQRRVLDLAPIHMRRLSRETGLTVVLSLWGSAGPVVSLVNEIGTGPILVTVRVGTTLDMDSAQGHLFLCFSKDHETIAKYWESLDPVKRRRIEAEVADAGKRGLSTVSAPVGMAVLAAPVFDDHGIAATVAVVGGPPDDAEIAAALRRAAFRITVEMGGAEVWRSLVPGGADDVADSVEAS